MRRRLSMGLSLRPFPRLIVAICLLAPAIVPSTLTAQPDTTSDRDTEALFEAARKGDLDDVKELVETGVDPLAKTRYGATALSYAADKGAVDLVRYLLARGADPSSQDSFYKMSPMAWALSKRPLEDRHVEIAVLLVEAGSKQVGEALMTAVQMARLDLISVALLSSQLSDDEVLAAHETAAGKNLAKLTETIEASQAFLRASERAATSKDMVEEFVLTPEASKAREQVYRDAERDLNMRVFRDGDRLKLQVYGQPSFDLVPTGPDEMMAPGVPGGAKLTFKGRAGTIETLLLEQGDITVSLRRHEGPFAPESATAAAARPAPAKDLEPVVAARGPARPWPSFRGANASGNADGQGLPLEWDGPSGKNILWKTKVPGMALASPVIWGQRVFIATAVSATANTTFRTGLYGDVDSVTDDSEHSWQLWALAKNNGEVLWQKEAARGIPQVKRHLKSSHANPTPATDGEHVVVNFASEGLFCFGVDGELHWKTDLGVLNSGWFYDPSYEWGFSSSPILHRGRVIVQVDIQQQSFLAAFDVETGKQLWRTPRDEIPTWGTPTILPAKGGVGVEEIVTNGPTIRGYDFNTGEQLWSLGPNSEVTVATPIVVDGMAIVTANYPPARPIYAIKAGQRGDLSLKSGEQSSDAIAWSHPTGGVYIPTPIAYQRIYYAMQMNGRLSAYDLETGERIYRQRVGSSDSFSGSSLAADGRLYFVTETGDTYVVEAGREFALLATNSLDEVVMTSPAASDGVLVIRGLEHVYGIGLANSDPPQGFDLRR